MKQILSSRNAYQIVLNHLKRNEGFKWLNIKELNLGRYAIVYGTKKNIAILFKTQWFNTYEYRNFRDVNGNIERGLGDTINKEDLKRFVVEKVTEIYTLYHTGDIYYISMTDFLMNSHSWKNKEGKEVRSISIHKYKQIHHEK